MGTHAIIKRTRHKAILQSIEDGHCWSLPIINMKITWFYLFVIAYSKIVKREENTEEVVTNDDANTELTTNDDPPSSDPVETPDAADTAGGDTETQNVPAEDTQPESAPADTQPAADDAPADNTANGEDTAETGDTNEDTADTMADETPSDEPEAGDSSIGATVFIPMLLALIMYA